jgi:hypothetical protein
MSPYLLEQVSPLFGWERLDQILCSLGQNALESDHEKITHQERVDVLRSPTHVFLLKVIHPLADGGFDFPLRFQDDLECVPFPSRGSHARSPTDRRPSPNRPFAGHLELFSLGCLTEKEDRQPV